MGDILGYARVSAGDQDIAGQTARLTRAGAMKVFRDIGSDVPKARPALQALLAAAGNGDTIAVVRLDRLGRTIAELLTTVATLQQRGIALLCLDEEIDTRSADGALILRLFAALAQCERRLAAERTKGEIAAAIAHGKQRSGWWSPGCRRPPQPGNCDWDDRQSIERSTGPASSVLRLRAERELTAGATKCECVAIKRCAASFCVRHLPGGSRRAHPFDFSEIAAPFPDFRMCSPPDSLVIGLPMLPRRGG